MPFQSEKQRRYLWANEPEIAREWTDRYGAADGGITRIGFRRGNPHSDGGGWSPGVSHSGSPSKSTPSHSPDRDGPAHLSHNAPAPYQDRIQRIAAQNKRTTDLRNRAGGEGFHQFLNKPPVGPKGSSGIGGGLRNFLGNWGSTVGGSQIGGGLGSMLFGPWGLLLGSIFGGGAGRRAYQASQTDEKETLRDILLGQDTLLSNLFKKKPTRQGIETIDIRDKFNRIKPKPINKFEWDTVVGEENPYKDFVTLAGLTKNQKKGLDAKKNHYKMGLIDADQVWESIKPWDDPEDPSTKQEVIEYLDT